MHESPGFQILSECVDGYISECTCCHEFNFVYKNIVLCFEQEELYRFLHWLLDTRYDPDSYFPMPHRRNRVYRSPLTNLCLAFNQEELEDIETLFAETQLVLEAQRVLKEKDDLSF
jgi:hypothetical protein